MKIEIKNKDKRKTNHWKYYEINAQTNQTKLTHKSKETQTHKQKNQMKPIEKQKAFMDLDLVEREK